MLWLVPLKGGLLWLVPLKGGLFAGWGWGEEGALRGPRGPGPSASLSCWPQGSESDRGMGGGRVLSNQGLGSGCG